MLTKKNHCSLVAQALNRPTSPISTSAFTAKLPQLVTFFALITMSAKRAGNRADTGINVSFDTHLNSPSTNNVQNFTTSSNDASDPWLLNKCSRN